MDRCSPLVFSNNNMRVKYTQQQQQGHNVGDSVGDNRAISPLSPGSPCSPSLVSKAEFILWLYASGSSTVAIDNKIEQAMDLVKSHLMFAVREEVDVLKEKITELLDRINQLEYENSVLRAGATQETLAKLATAPPPSTTQPQSQSQPPSSQTS